MVSYTEGVTYTDQRLSSSYKMPFAMTECKLAVVFVLLTLWIPVCAAQYTYNVYPICATDRECLTLSGIVNEREKYFTSNMTLVFHPGDHSLQGEPVSVANVSNLTLRSSTTSSSSSAPVTRIVCDNSSLSFSGVSDLHIVSINFVSCRNVLSFTVSVFQDCSFENSTAVNGGVMSVNSGGNATFLGHTVFTGNIATQKGGAIFASNSIITFSGKTTFAVNHAHFVGGAVYAEENNNLSFRGTSSFEGNTAVYHGGALKVYDNNILSFSGTSNFEGNTADFYGGALYVYENNTLNFSGNSSFEGNTVNRYGGALYVHENNTLNFRGNSSFEGNTANLYGGALYVYENNTLSFSETSNFEGNTAYDGGGALRVWGINNLSFSGNSNFEGNTAGEGGALHAELYNTLSFSGTSNFEGNTAYNGGAMHVSVDNTLSFHGSSNFEGNTATDCGGALSVRKDSTVNFSGNSYFEGNNANRGGALCSLNSGVIFAGKTLFSSNTANLFGGALYAVDSVTHLTESFTITENEAADGGGIFVQGGRIAFQGEGSCMENKASQDGYGGAVLAISCIVKFSGTYELVSNTAGFGGGMALAGIKDRTLLLEPGTNLSFNRNTAHKRGGALYVEDNPFTYCIFNPTTEAGVRDACFIQLSDQHACEIVGGQFLDIIQWSNSIPYVNLNFDNNTAVESGGDLYGGDLDSCGICIPLPVNNYRPFQGLGVFREVTNTNMYSELKISSNPYRVCTCTSNYPNCNQTSINIQKYPGEILTLILVSVGQTDGPVPSVIRAVTENLKITPLFKVTQPTENKSDCTELQYPLFSDDIMNARLKLYSDEPCSTSGFPFTVHITFLPCPVGFILSDQGMCICEERLQKYTQKCMIETLTIRRERSDGFWAGLEDTTRPGLVLHPHCPFDYCTEEAVDFTLNSTDLQCSTGRSGTLCGSCQSGHSLALGSTQCLSSCSNKSLALLLVFAAAGVVLVAFLFLCRITVAEGTLSGLIFYANVLAVNQSIFFPAGTTNVLTVFIAWLNLDLGIETCFFVGLDAYSRTWLQFVFPIYIWVLVGVVMYLADATTTFARIIGRTNPVAVLATLFLLSYTKLLRAIMAAFSFTTLDYPDNESRLVWLYDGNIDYLVKHDGRHIVLFLVSLLVFLFVFLPYTLLLFCGQWIQRKFQLRWLSPTKQLYLKAFLDAYYAPYSDKHRYWTGLMLLLRFFIVLLSTLVNIESPQDPFVSLAVLQVTVSGMLLWAWLAVHRLYKRWYLNILEASFMFNLIVLIGGTYQIRLSGGNQAALAYTSVSIAFTTFIGIVICGVVQQGKKVIERRRRAALQLAVNTEIRDEEEPPQSPAAAPASNVTYSVVEIIRHNSREDDVEMKPLVAVPEENH